MTDYDKWNIKWIIKNGIKNFYLYFMHRVSFLSQCVNLTWLWSLHIVKVMMHISNT